MTAVEQSRTADADIQQLLSEKADIDSMVYTEDAEHVPLASFFDSDRRPIVIVPGYYSCPRLCGLVFNGMRSAIDELADSGMYPGRDFRVLSYSFDEYDSPETASEKGQVYRIALEEEVSADTWHFLTAEKTEIDRFMDSLGYEFTRNGEDFDHAAGIMILTPKGVISRYMFGIEFPYRELRLSLVEASDGKIGSPVDNVLLMCFRYDSLEGKYVPFVMGFVRLGGLLTLIFLAGLMIFLRLKERSA